MSRMIQVRVSDSLHRELKRRAAARGQKLTDYIQELLEMEAARPQTEEIFQRIAVREPVDLERPAADLVREERSDREVS